MFQTQPFEVSDFSGGITDNYIDGPVNTYQYADNFFITENRKLKTRGGSAIVDTTNYLPNYLLLNQRTSSLIVFNQEIMFEQQGRNLYYNSSGYNTLTGPSGNPTLAAGDTTNFCSWTEWNQHLIVTNDAFGNPMKVYKDAGGVYRVRNAGMPKLASSPTVVPGAAGAGSYIYAFLYYYTYTIGTVTYEDYGATTLVSLTASAAPNITPVPITNIPVVANGVTDNYDTTVMKVKIYRTVNNGTTFYYVNQVTNGTTTYSDTTSDATLITSTLIYTDSGAYDNDPPPKAKYVITANDCVWYLHCQEGTQVFKNRVRQSIKYDPDSCPAAFNSDMEDEITGGAAIGIYPIIFCKNRVYRLEGIYDQLGRGGIEKREISRTVGCVSNNSIVTTRYGIFFAGKDGFYFTDGFQVQKISDQLNTTYKKFVLTSAQQLRIYGVYEPINNRIYWAVQKDAALSDNDSWVVLDLRWGISERMSMTTASGGTSFAPSSMCLYNDVLYRSDRRGYLFYHSDALSTDPRVDVLAVPSAWQQQAITYNHVSMATPFGVTSLRKWVPSVVVSAQNISNTSVAISGINDDSGIENPLKELRFRSNLTWGDSSPTWRDPTLVWNFNKLLEGKRMFPAGGLRCSLKQLKLTNSLSILENSDNLGTATVDSASLTVTLNTAPTNIWPADAVDYFIYFSTDNYTTAFQITGRTTSVLTVTDPAIQLQNLANAQWIIRGIIKGDLLHLLSYNMMFYPISQTQTPYQGETGGNAT